MLIDLTPTEGVTGTVIREAFLGDQYGFELQVADDVFFIQIIGQGTFAISEVIEIGSKVGVPINCLDHKATVVSSRSVKIL